MRISVVLLLLAFACSAQTYYPQPHRVSAFFGSARPAHGPTFPNYSGSPVFSAQYGYRFARYGQFDTGVDVVWGRYSEGDTNRDRTHYIVPFGYRAVLPLLNDRLETSIGAGAAHIWYKPARSEYDGWLVYGLFEASYAIDEGGRFRPGLQVKWYRDPIGTPVQQWVHVGATFSYSFGR